MLGRLEDQSESVVQPREAFLCAAVGEARQCEVGRRVVIAIVIDRYSQEVSIRLATQQRGVPVVTDTTGVAEVVAPVFNRPGSHVPGIEAIDADDAHLRITGWDLLICRAHVVRGEDHPWDRDVHTPGLQDHSVAHVVHVREGARCHCLARTNKVTVMQRFAGVVDEPDFVHSDWLTIRVEHRQTVGSALVLLTLDDSMALDRPARHPGAQAVFGTKLGERHGLTTETRRDVCLGELP